MLYHDPAIPLKIRPRPIGLTETTASSSKNEATTPNSQSRPWPGVGSIAKTIILQAWKANASQSPLAP